MIAVLERIKVGVQSLLETSAQSVDGVARAEGYRDATAFRATSRRLFKARTARAPVAYRLRFSMARGG